MGKKFYIRAAAILALCVTLATVFTGCLSTAESIDDPQKANRNYMAQLNSALADFGDDLEAFSVAVSDDDVVGMKSQADKAFKVIEEIEKIEAPEDLADLHDGYKKALGKLKEALNEFIDLYVEVKAYAENDLAEGESLETPDFEEKLKSIQKKYSEGIKLLEDADNKATNME